MESEPQRVCYEGNTTVQEVVEQQNKLRKRWATTEEIERQEHEKINREIYSKFKK